MVAWKATFYFLDAMMYPTPTGVLHEYHPAQHIRSSFSTMDSGYYRAIVTNRIG